MKNKIELISSRLQELIPKKNIYHSSLFEAANYSLSSKGKRIRPLLVLMVVEAFKKDFKSSIDPACAIELIHTYSLIHDDLPAMDDDDIRRGKPSLHKAYPEWLAILTGDYLLTYAFEILTNAKDLSDGQRIELIKVLSKYSGGNGLIAGQVVDLSSERKDIDIDTLEFMHLNKTSSLFMAAIEFGCIISKADTDTRSKFIEFGKYLGLSFQIKDDILDVESSAQTLGKPIHSDENNNKSTYVSLLGLDEAKKTLNELQTKAIGLLSSLEIDYSELSTFTKKVFSRIN